MKNNNSYDFSELKEQIRAALAEQYKYGRWDAIVYNSSTVLAITLASLAALVPELSQFNIKLFSGIAAILIALDRALNWGARWIYHRQMCSDYSLIQSKISFYENIPEYFSDDERKELLLKIFAELSNIKMKEGSMPGVKTEK